jgi:hypothetical protein
MTRIGQNHTYIRIYGVYTAILAGTLPYIRSCTVYIYGSGQPYRRQYICVQEAHSLAFNKTQVQTVNQARGKQQPVGQRAYSRTSCTVSRRIVNTRD